MIKLSDKFLDDMEGYLRRSGLDATAFGRKALRDPSFVFEVRAGRSPSLKTIDRVRLWMARNPAGQMARSLQKNAAAPESAQPSPRPESESAMGDGNPVAVGTDPTAAPLPGGNTSKGEGA